ncbi:hypothetical protein FRC12_018822, partial [Ceratobasidium sp. 428]
VFDSDACSEADSRTVSRVILHGMLKPRIERVLALEHYISIKYVNAPLVADSLNDWA